MVTEASIQINNREVSHFTPDLGTVISAAEQMGIGDKLMGVALHGGAVYGSLYNPDFQIAIGSDYDAVVVLEDEESHATFSRSFLGLPTSQSPIGPMTYDRLESLHHGRVFSPYVFTPELFTAVSAAHANWGENLSAPYLRKEKRPRHGHHKLLLHLWEGIRWFITCNKN